MPRCDRDLVRVLVLWLEFEIMMDHAGKKKQCTPEQEHRYERRAVVDEQCAHSQRSDRRRVGICANWDMARYQIIEMHEIQEVGEDDAAGTETMTVRGLFHTGLRRKNVSAILSVALT